MADAHSNVLVLGQSFSRHLQDWSFRNNCLNLNLDRSRVTVFWHGTRGATVLCPRPPHKMLWQDMHLIRELEVDIVFLDVGSNDLSNKAHDWLTHSKLADCILRLSKECLNFGAKQVLISEILPRRNLQTFNTRVEETNKEIKLLVQEDPYLYFWQHNHNNFSSHFLSDYVHRDGIHVDPVRGMTRYFSSVRGSIIFAENHLLQA